MCILIEFLFIKCRCDLAKLLKNLLKLKGIAYNRIDLILLGI